MFATCPQCQTVFRVSASQLRDGHGEVRCGNCLQIFDAVAALSDQAPGEGTEQTASVDGGELLVSDLDGVKGESKQGAIVSPDDALAGNALQSGAAYQGDGQPPDRSVPAGRQQHGDTESIGRTLTFLPLPALNDVSKGQSTQGSADSDLPNAQFSGSKTGTNTASMAELIAGSHSGLADVPTRSSGAESNAQAPGAKGAEQIATVQVVGDRILSRRVTVAQPEVKETGSVSSTQTSARQRRTPAAGQMAGGSIAALEASLDLPAKPRGGGLQSAMWLAFALLLLAVLGLQYVWFHPTATIAKYPQSVVLVRDFCKWSGCSLPAPRDPKQISIISRDVRVHPEHERVLQVTLAIQNDAPFAQAYPPLRLTLFDVNGATLATRTFAPRDYLSRPIEANEKLGEGERLQITLQLLTPSEPAVSFEFVFL